ncbi:MAG: NADP-dependent malic enzyme [Alphaproteobacteria bacterium]|nr:MAG: NADP-dependent malic enzyme [Alphaproteobacteria bacterium]TAF76526.1 MAG: NADP-dependent malic enzyme [Alphaproteobacteria bacterium]
MTNDLEPITDEEALEFHRRGQPGKLAVHATKPLLTQRDLSLSYSPGVAVPCKHIALDPDLSFEYTARGNFVAVISNGTAVLGLGNLGALASKPVMEGKSVLFKRFADIDSIDLEVDTEDAQEFINVVKYLGPSWGGINLEDIAAPDCFIIEQKLRELMDIPVFHDDQHGTAIITLAGLMNAAQITGRRFEEMKVVVNGAGAAGIACLELIKRSGVPHENVILCDRMGVVYEGRLDGDMNQWKSAHAIPTDKRTLKEALEGADVFIGLSVAGAVSKDMIAGMAPQPIVFAMANPVPEIMPDEVKEVRPDAIVATGRSDFPNQVNNVMGFPYIFRGALDVRAREVNEEMKIAAAQALAQLAREEVPEEVRSAYARRTMAFGSDYIIPTPFDPRLIYTVPVAVAKAAIETGVARKIVTDFTAYQQSLKARLDPTANTMNRIYERVRSCPQRMVFAEGEEERSIRAAVNWRDSGYGAPILVGREDLVVRVMTRMGITNREGIDIVNAANSPHVEQYIETLYKKLQRDGFLHRDIVRMVKNDRNTFAASIVEHGHADAMVTGLTRSYNRALENVCRVVGQRQGEDDLLMAVSVCVAKGRTTFIADTMVQELPTAKELTQIAIHTARVARRFGHEPRVAFLSFSNFGNPMREKSQRIRGAVELMNQRTDVDFEYEGEMSADVALNKDLLALYPFNRLTAPANVLVMPALHSANIASAMMHELGNGSMLGPVVVGLNKPIQIAQMNASVSDVMNLAAVAAMEAIAEDERVLEQ